MRGDYRVPYSHEQVCRMQDPMQAWRLRPVQRHSIFLMSAPRPAKSASRAMQGQHDRHRRHCSWRGPRETTRAPFAPWPFLAAAPPRRAGDELELARSQPPGALLQWSWAGGGSKAATTRASPGAGDDSTPAATNVGERRGQLTRLVAWAWALARIHLRATPSACSRSRRG